MAANNLTEYTCVKNTYEGNKILKIKYFLYFDAFFINIFDRYKCVRIVSTRKCFAIHILNIYVIFFYDVFIIYAMIRSDINCMFRWNRG